MRVARGEPAATALIRLVCAHRRRKRQAMSVGRYAPRLVDERDEPRRRGSHQSEASQQRKRQRSSKPTALWRHCESAAARHLRRRERPRLRLGRGGMRRAARRRPLRRGAVILISIIGAVDVRSRLSDSLASTASSERKEILFVSMSDVMMGSVTMSVSLACTLEKAAAACLRGGRIVAKPVGEPLRRGSRPSESNGGMLSRDFIVGAAGAE